MVNELGQKIHDTTDDIIDAVIEKGEADFVTDIAAELPLVVIADLLGVPQEDRHSMFDWSNRMIGQEDPEYQRSDVSEEYASEAAMELYAYAAELFATKRAAPTEDLMSVLAGVEVEGDKLSELELELFFLLLTVAGNETTRNLISGAMHAFFDHPDQWSKLVAEPALLPSAVEEMLRYVTPVMNFRRQTTAPFEIRGQKLEEDQKVVFFHVSGNRDEDVFDDPDSFDITRSPNPHMAFGGGGPHFCLGANLARMEIRVMFQHLLDRMPDMRLDGEPQRLQSAFINGVKHLPVAFTPAKPVRR
jgi:cholest-4-en-3-one 26-monooxygenase